MEKEIIVIIGGPGTGKTTIIGRLISKGFCCYPEISREITIEAQKQGIEQLFLKKPLLFSKLLLEGRKKQYKDALKEPHDIVFIDRGIPDILAYLNYIGTTYPPVFETTCKEHLYSKIFILPPWEEIYESDEARYENYEQSKLIYNHIHEIYQNLGYNLIEVPKDTPENRILFILDKISN